MRKLFLVCGLALMIISCKEISGTLTVSQDFSANVNKKCGWNPFGGCDPNKKMDIPAGNYTADINFGSKTEIKIQMKANAFKENLILKRPKNFEFPANGEFSLSKEQVNQSFDVKGNITTNVWDSGIQRGNESCSYTRPEWVCGNDPGGGSSCRYEYRTVWGYRFVEFYNRNITKDMSADLMDSQRSLARFTGTRTDVEKIYTFTSVCH